MQGGFSFLGFCPFIINQCSLSEKHPTCSFVSSFLFPTCSDSAAGFRLHQHARVGYDVRFIIEKKKVHRHSLACLMSLKTVATAAGVAFAGRRTDHGVPILCCWSRFNSSCNMSLVGRKHTRLGPWGFCTYRMATSSVNLHGR
jgi:hypothetical protein